MTWRVATVALFALAIACARSTPSNLRPALAFEGVTFARAAELPIGQTGARRDGTAPQGVAFGRACAMRLRDPRDSTELLLVRSEVSVKEARGGKEIRLERAEGEYIQLSGDENRRATGPLLRVDCVTGRALGWANPET